MRASVVRSRGSRSSDDIAMDFVEVGGELMTPWIDVDGWVKGLDVDGLLDAPPDPVLLRGKCDDVFFPEMVLVVAGVLEHCRLVFAESVSGSRGMLLETGRDGSLCLADISAWARCRVGSSAGYVVDVANFHSRPHLLPWMILLGAPEPFLNVISKTEILNV